MYGDAKDGYPAVEVFHDRAAVQPGEEHGVAVKEVASENSVCLAAQELRPGRDQRRGDGSIPARLRIAQTVEAPT
jgi:hypothetical protein